MDQKHHCQVLWAKNKYLVLSRSSNIYKEIREYLKRDQVEVSPEWWESTYRGKTCPAYPELEEEALSLPIYPEHHAGYLKECLDNLAEKGIQLD